MSEPLTDEELDRIANLANAATAGPWEAFVTGRNQPTGDDFIRCGLDDTEPDMSVSLWYGTRRLPAPVSDLDFIASARQDVPRLVEEVRRLREQVSR